MGTAAHADRITVEVIRNYFISTAYQMRGVIERTSFNPVIYEMRDFAVGIFDRNYETIAVDPGIPIFVGAIGLATEAIVNHIGAENLEDGDVLLSTYYPYTGSHCSDVTVITPVFADGEVVSYVTSKAHWMDMGGKDIAMTDSTDMFQEGLVLRAVKIRKKGKTDPEILDVLLSNTRLVDVSRGDLNAQLAAGDYGRKMVLDLVAKYGRDIVRDAIAQILDHGEQVTRDIIRSIPDGTYRAEGMLDDDGIEIGKNIPVKLTVTVEGDSMTFDSSGSGGMTKGPMNAPFASTYATLTLLSKVLLTPDYPSNGGCFRPLKVTAPEGTLFNAVPPAPVYLYGWSLMCLFELGYKALAEAIPDRVVARSGGDIAGFEFLTRDADGNPIAGGGDEGIGQGASQEADGANGLIHQAMGGVTQVPIEIMEERYPVVFERYALMQDSGGAGRFRGGLGIEKQLRALAGLHTIIAMEQTKTPGWGLFGGKSSPVATIAELRAGTENEWRTGKATGFLVPEGERIRILTGGGGGWGDARQRPVEEVLRDVQDGYVSVKAARSEYGVAIVERDGQLVVDEEETAQLRSGRDR